MTITRARAGHEATVRCRAARVKRLGNQNAQADGLIDIRGRFPLEQPGDASRINPAGIERAT